MNKDNNKYFNCQLKSYKNNKKDNFMSNTSNEIWLDMNAVSEFLNLKISYVRKLIMKRAFEYSKPSGKVYVKKSVLLNWLESGTCKSADQIRNEAVKYCQDKAV
jgi:hypothetical protein